ncbi:MAG: metalloregulator ArsR/SmtB family transcription factor [Opitutales bacterium]
MPYPWDTLKLLSDPTRLRLLLLLLEEELSVAEMQEVLDMGQSRISSHLSLLRQGEIVTDRRHGKKTFYSIRAHLSPTERNLIHSACASVADLNEVTEDRKNLHRVLEKRRRYTEEYFNSIAGRLGKNYCPGRSWEAIGHFLLKLTPSIKIADLGAGEGLISQLLAQRAETVYCVDNSPRMVEVGKELAKKNTLSNLHYRLGDIEKVPLPDDSIDVAILSQALHHARHPQTAVREAQRILKPAGQVIILDLKEHHFERARELYADLWLGFSENTLYNFLHEAGFQHIEINTVSREKNEPYFETLLACAVKTGGGEI